MSVPRSLDSLIKNHFYYGDLVSVCLIKSLMFSLPSEEICLTEGTKQTLKTRKGLTESCLQAINFNVSEPKSAVWPDHVCPELAKPLPEHVTEGRLCQQPLIPQCTVSAQEEEASQLARGVDCQLQERGPGKTDNKASQSSKNWESSKFYCIIKESFILFYN